MTTQTPGLNAKPVQPFMQTWTAMAMEMPQLQLMPVRPGRVLLQTEREIEVVKGRRNHIVREEFLELNPGDAQSWAIEAGDRLEVQTAGTRLEGVARLADSVPAGVVSITGLFGQLAVDLQSSEEWDPASRVPGLHIVPAAVLNLSEPSGPSQPAESDVPEDEPGP